MKLPDKIQNEKKGRTTGIVSIILLMLVFMVACEKENGSSDYNPPSDHTISEDGYMHRSGLNQPLDNCVSCHGADLQGGNVGVSCYECHGKKW